jgi:hypothetical protein
MSKARLKAASSGKVFEEVEKKMVDGLKNRKLSRSDSTILIFTF